LEELSGIESLDLGANRGELITAYAEAIGSASALDRQKRLLADKIGSEADFKLAQTAYQKAWATYVSLRDQLAFTNKRALDERTRAITVAEAELKSAERHLFAFGFPSAAIAQLTTESPEQIGRYELKSPIAGSIIEQHIVLGEMLKDDAQPFLVADLGALWINLIAYQKDLPLIKAGQKATISFGPNIPDATGAVTYISPLLNDASRAALIRVDLPNPESKWKPGLFVTGRVTVETKEVPLLLPVGAVQTMEGKPVVFVQTKRGLEVRAVTLGSANSTHVEITSGLTTGKPVAVTNTFIVKAELSKSEAEHEH
jgi:cobalt-zinc-cadmium efflux system membrane fusion protein